MISSNISATPKLAKLLRTLIEYQAELVLVPVGQAVRVWHNKQWIPVHEHPIVSSAELHAHIRGTFGEQVSEELDHGLKTFFEYREHRFLFRFLKDNEGGLFLMERLKPLPEPEQWPAEAHTWLRNGGFLEVQREELYAALLKAKARNTEGLVISLEKTIKYPLSSQSGSLTQREQNTHFSSLEKAFQETLSLHPQVLGLSGLALTQEGKEKLHKMPFDVLCCQSSDTLF